MKPIPSFIADLPEYLEFFEEARSIEFANVFYPKKDVLRAAWLRKHLPYSYVTDWDYFMDKITDDLKEWDQWVMKNISCWCYTGTNREATFHFVDENEMMLFKMRWG